MTEQLTLASIKAMLEAATQEPLEVHVRPVIGGLSEISVVMCGGPTVAFTGNTGDDCALSDARLFAAAPSLARLVLRLADALVKLSNEAGGSTGAFEPEMREAMGNTNFACLELRVTEASSLLTELGQPEKEDHDEASR